MEIEAYERAVQEGRAEEWLNDEVNRARGKKAFLALGYGSQARTLAPQLGWSIEKTQGAIDRLMQAYRTLEPLRELTLKEIIHTGEVRTLWGRPRRINGYYQLARPERVTVQFRLGSSKKRLRRTYEARIIPLGTYRQGVQAFIEECHIVYTRPDGTLERSLILAGNMDGTVAYRARANQFVDADHFNNIPFRNISFSSIRHVRTQSGLKHFLPRQSRAVRMAMNSMAQSTGADHLRWLMNRMRLMLQSRPDLQDCKLVLTIHDSLLFEVPQSLVQVFVDAAYPVMTTRPDWADIDFRVKCEHGRRFGEMESIEPTP